MLSLLKAQAVSSTPDSFIAAVKSALDSKDAEQLLSLTYTAGMSDEDKQKTVAIDRMVLFADPVSGISLGSLPSDFQTVYITSGKKIEVTASPSGTVQIKFVKGASNGATSSALPYAIISGGYYIVASKTTDLGWKGPPDKTLTFMVMGAAQNDVRIDVKWNASGVDQERIFKSTSTGFMGQYFQSVDVTSSSSSNNITLTLMENGKTIYVSDPVKGKGLISYRK